MVDDPRDTGDRSDVGDMQIDRRIRKLLAKVVSQSEVRHMVLECDKIRISISLGAFDRYQIHCNARR